MSDRDEEIKKAATQIANEAALPLIRSMYPSRSRGQMANEFRHFILQGAQLADSHPDQERISKFTSNLIDENKEQFKKLTQATALLERAKGIIESIQFMRIPPLRQEVGEWLKEFETVMKREGGE